VRGVVAVVVGRDRPAVLVETLAAIRSEGPERIIGVANGATPDVVTVFRGQADVVVELPANTGAAGGFHAGLERALASGAEYAWCFDDDARPEPGCLHALLGALAARPRAGAAGAAAHTGDGVTLSWQTWVGGEPLTTVGALRARGAAALPVAGLSWHATLLRLDALRDVGNVWAELFHQYEDAELSLRLQRGGWGTYVVPAATCVHPPAPPATRTYRVLGRELWIRLETPAKLYLTTRNDLVVRRRYGGARFWLLTGQFIAVRGLLTALALRPRAVRVWLRALADAARGRLGPPPAY
jgi:rhamnopyranosyl-N-acetylglucosaminyl-diphospho-decaprenol beta-1,3/1,4-galactofuranosyltransferase